MPAAAQTRLTHYGVSILIVAAALLLRWCLWPVLGPELPFLFLWPAVLLAAWHGGFRPGLLATVLAALAADRLLLVPAHAWTPADATGLTLFITLGATLSLVTARMRHLQAELRQRADELAEAARHKDEFMAMLAHELRNPLAAIRNAAEVLKQLGPDDEACRQPVEVVDRQARQIDRLVGDLLDVSRVSRGKLRLQKGPVELAEVVERAVECSRPLLAARLHELTETLPAGPVWLDADAARLVQVVSNLLNNAAKYTPERGRVWLSAGREGGEVVLRVRDNGIGIAPEMLLRVFERYAQADRALGQSQGGLGLGLTLVQGLVKMHGGSVQAFSEGPGRGSEFVVRLPALEEKVAAGSKEGESVLSAPALRVLVVDDNVDGAESLALLLRACGHEVRTAHDGPSAIARARGHRPDVVLLDIGLLGMDGCEVARRLRQEAGQEKLLLVAMTGYGSEGDRRRSAEAGFDRHLVKPVDLAQLQALLNGGTLTTAR